MHYRIFETWRLAAAVAIMIYHFLRFGPPEALEAGAFLHRFLPLMEMFFMISGYLIMERYGDVLMRGDQGFGKYLLRRIARIYPLYLVTLGFFLLVTLAIDQGLVSTDNPQRFDWSTLPANILLIQAWGFTEHLTFNYVSWSLSAEWFCYLLLPAIVITYRMGGAGGLAVLAFASILALEIGIALGLIPFDSWLEANTWGAYRAFADFVLGALVAVVVARSRSGLTSQAPGWILFGVALAAMGFRLESYVIVLLLALAMYFAAIAERNRPEATTYLAPLHPLGKVSLGIYLIHPVVESVLLAIVWRWWIDPLVSSNLFYAFLIVPALVVFALSILSDRFFERPVGKAIVSLGDRRLKRGQPAHMPAE
ncbi:acyltransferase family protein [Chelativorans sp. ZYF759]|uniref:acyltransferase family protein n=1 Tax=Chelativorans sp. ZYF759 TaxID=2692213 RepID=UPI00145EDB34|nr:acyltransferase [Chelativorans sp. ZYF759]NMG41624.1 acyltransferase family protein [Chelativorans sp. ZYF759]